MKTSRNAYARMQAIIIILFALNAFLPAYSQQSNNGFKTASFILPEKKNFFGMKDLLSVSDPVARQLHPLASKETPQQAEVVQTPVMETGATTVEPQAEASSENMEFSFKTTSYTYPTTGMMDAGIAEFPADQLILYAKALKQYAIQNGYDTSYAILSNMGMLCNKKRLFIINLSTLTIEQSGLVSHGRGQGPTVWVKQYSNQPGSRCTSLGHYKIGAKYKGNYGDAYRLEGLDTTNMNAQSRSIVLHSMGCIPEKEGFMPACVSDGCPAVSPGLLMSLFKILDTRQKPVLLWLFDSNLEEIVVNARLEKTEEKISETVRSERNAQDAEGIMNFRF
ncbi:MAG TPA: murein L,D-transpeptidase catalytic domain family protein [Chitinophagaceae bacterium]|nr:murein L,D-transpeptidase catalytic domain family protein [Chitinophagaceae bacterium]